LLVEDTISEEMATEDAAMQFWTRTFNSERTECVRIEEDVKVSARDPIFTKNMTIDTIKEEEKDGGLIVGSQNCEEYVSTEKISHLKYAMSRDGHSVNKN
jgi:hypothetical protein